MNGKAKIQDPFEGLFEDASARALSRVGEPWYFWSQTCRHRADTPPQRSIRRFEPIHVHRRRSPIVSGLESRDKIRPYAHERHPRGVVA